MASTTYWTVNGTMPPVIDEFGQDPTEPAGSAHNDDCGPCAETNGNAALARTRPTYTQMHAIRTRDIAVGWFTPGSGNTISNINSDVTTYMKRSTAYYPYHEWYQAADVISICEKFHGAAIVVGICLAYLLPFNEAGVHCHYVVILAYDGAAGKVLIGNGDREPHGGPDWILISDLAKCQMYGFVAMMGATTLMTLDISQTGGAFTQNADGSWHCVSTGKNVGGGIQNFYRGVTAPFSSLGGFTDLGLALTDETATGKPKVVGGFQPRVQVFERGALAADPDKVLDSPPGAGVVYKMHLNHPAVLAVIAPPTPPTPPPDVSAEFNAVSADLTKAQSDMAALKAKLDSQVK